MSGVCTSTGGLVMCEEFAPVLLVFSVASPATASSPAERVLAEANMPVPGKALRMNPRPLLLCAPGNETHNPRRFLANNGIALAEGYRKPTLSSRPRTELELRFVLSKASPHSFYLRPFKAYAMREAKGDISMKLGVFTPVFVNRSLDQVVAKLRSLSGISAIEFATGGWPGRDHVEVDALLASPHKLDDFGSQIRDAGLTISALSCHGNPMHPNRATAREHDEAFRKSVKLAEKLNVPVVVTFSGCPGDSDEAKCPNWIVAPWPPEFLETLEWQWDKKVIPYWQDAGTFAADHGIKVAIEPHPGFVVYNVETALRLRAASGKNVGVNFDPSHLFWQGADIPVTIRALDGCIFHVHAKDSALDAANVARNGVLDAKSYRHLADRSWLFRTVGWGHDELEWKRIVSALRMSGYDYVMSIEHEDALASVDEGLRAAIDLLSRVILTEPPVDAWWT